MLKNTLNVTAKPKGGFKPSDVAGTAKDILEKFSSLFILNCGCNILEQVREEVRKKKGEGRKEVTRRLIKREKPKTLRRDPYRGELWMKVGGGAGDFGQHWRNVFVVENSCDIVVYDCEKSADAGKKPIARIAPAGYQLITEVKQHYKSDLKNIMHDIREVDAEYLTEDLEPGCWALYHPHRQNYVFLARKNKLRPKQTCALVCSNKCHRKKIDPEIDWSESDEERESRERATDFMGSCIDCAQPRDTSTIEGKSFDLTMRQLPNELSGQISEDWTDDGTESEMLVDILMEACLVQRRNTILNERKGPTYVRIKWWNKIRKTVHNILSGLVDTAWKAARSAFTALRESIEPVIRSGLEPIVEFRMMLESKIRETVIDKLGELLGIFVTPFIKPLMELYENPLRESLETGRKMLEERLNPSALPEDPAEREIELEKLMDDVKCRVSLFKALDLIEERLQGLRALSDIGPHVVQGTRLAKVRSQIQSQVDELLDAAMYTYMLRLRVPTPEASEALPAAEGKSKIVADDGGVSNPALEPDTPSKSVCVGIEINPTDVYHQLLADFDHDVQIVRSEFVKRAVHSLLLEIFHRFADPSVKPIIRTVDSAIPSSLQKFISIENAFDQIVERFVWLPIDKAVEAAYPLPVD